MAKDKKMGPPSKKELVDKARDAIQSQEERKTLFPTSDIRQTDKKLGDPKTYFTAALNRRKSEGTKENEKN
jgi:hypothetical protein